MLDKARGLADLVKSGLVALRDTDLSQVQYLSLGLALGAGLFILLTLLYKLLWGKNKFKRPYSGHAISREYQRGSIVGIIYLLPRLFLVLGILFLLIALANPYLPRTQITENIESIEWIHLIDRSTSNGWEYENTGKSGGEITHRAFIKFLEMRKGQNDRASLWYFHGAPTMVEDFIIDDDVYRIQAEDMPFLITDPGNSFLPENDKENKLIDVIAPRDRIKMVMNGGGTNLVGALDAVIKHFDRNGDKKIKQKVLLVETDMAIDADPDKQLRQLKKRKIKVHVLHIKPNVLGETQAGNQYKLENAKKLKEQFEKYGFKYYDIQNRRSLDIAYHNINTLEKSPSKIMRHLLKVLVYQRPLLAGVVFIFMFLGTGLITEYFFGEDP